MVKTIIGLIIIAVSFVVLGTDRRSLLDKLMGKAGKDSSDKFDSKVETSHQNSSDEPGTKL